MIAMTEEEILMWIMYLSVPIGLLLSRMIEEIAEEVMMIEDAEIAVHGKLNLIKDC